MIKFEYTKTYFAPPPRISLYQYEQFKSALYSNPNFEIDLKPEKFLDLFKPYLMIWGGFAIYTIILIIVSKFTKVYGIFYLPILIGLMSIPFGIIRLLLEAPSYARYLKKKKNYFSNLKYAILSTNSYAEFYELFYHDVN